MAWPTDNLTTTHLDAATDDPSQARVELKAAIDKLKSVLAEVTAAATVWHSANDGAGSGLNADLVDGLQASSLLARGNHTGTQAQSTITGLVSALAGKVGLTTNITSGTAVGANTYFQLGNILINLGSGTVSKNSTTSITFSVAFTAVVAVVASPITAPQDFDAHAENISNTGFDITADSSSGAASTTFHYIAVGYKS